MSASEVLVRRAASSKARRAATRRGSMFPGGLSAGAERESGPAVLDVFCSDSRVTSVFSLGSCGCGGRVSVVFRWDTGSVSCSLVSDSGMDVSSLADSLKIGTSVYVVAWEIDVPALAGEGGMDVPGLLVVSCI